MLEVGAVGEELGRTATWTGAAAYRGDRAPRQRCQIGGGVLAARRRRARRCAVRGCSTRTARGARGVRGGRRRRRRRRPSSSPPGRARVARPRRAAARARACGRRSAAGSTVRVVVAVVRAVERPRPPSQQLDHRSWTASRSSSVALPLAAAGWLDATTSCAARVAQPRSSPAAAPGTSVTSSGRYGDSGCRARVPDRLVEHAVAIEEDRRPSSTPMRLPLAGLRGERGMRDEQVPDHGLEAPRRAACGAPAGPARRRRRRRRCAVVAVGLADDPVDRSRRPRVASSSAAHEVHRDVVLARAAADGEDQDARRRRRSARPAARRRTSVSQPSSLIRAVSSETLSVGV